MPSAIDDYLARLERVLRQHGFAEVRIVDEVREHLRDAAADGRERGLSVEHAEREAIERFGPPETIAAHVVQEEGRVMYRLAAMFDTVWKRKWWILAPTLMTAMATSMASYYFLPTRYRSESVVGIVPPRVPAEYVRPTGDDAAARLQVLRQQILSRTRLERLIRDLRLYEVEQERTPLDELVLQMRRDVNVEYFPPDRTQDDGLGVVRVSFVSSDPNAAAKVTLQLASLIVKENVQERELRAEGVTQFIDAQIADVRRRLLEYENTLEKLRAQSGQRPLSPAHLLPYAVLQERYKELLAKGEEARTALHLERRQIGESFRVVEGPQVPERPVGPSRLSVNLAGTFAGLGLGLVLVRRRGRSNATPASC